MIRLCRATDWLDHRRDGSEQIFHDRTDGFCSEPEMLPEISLAADDRRELVAQTNSLEKAGRRAPFQKGLGHGRSQAAQYSVLFDGNNALSFLCGPNNCL